MVEDGPPTPRNATRSDTFNGASTTWSRMVHRDTWKSATDSLPSTGPRPRGRGWARRRSSRHRRTGTFNGASTTWSRMESRSAAARRRIVPSTGPRPRGRGWPHLPRTSGVADRPSTGPRPRGRGWESSCRRARRSSGFNGASTTWSRMGLIQILLEVPPTLLQRGLDHVVEDGRHAGDRRAADLRASTGPRPRGRGWGNPEARNKPNVKRFNGASTTWSRMVLKSDASRFRVVVLQRGLDHVVEDGHVL